MTTTVSAPVHVTLCRRGLHELNPDNHRVRDDGANICLPCNAADARDRGDRIRKRMVQLVVGFAYWPEKGWEHRSVCRDAEAELFDLADQDSGHTRDDVTRISLERHLEARDYCEVCPVVAQCLGDALVRQARGTRGGELFTDADWNFTPKTLLKELGL